MKTNRTDRVALNITGGTVEVWRNLQLLCAFYNLPYHKVYYHVTKHGQYEEGGRIVQRKYILSKSKS